MFEVRPLIEMPLEGAREKTQIVLLDVRAVVFPDEKILLVYDREGRQHLDRFRSCGVHRLVFGRGNGKEFR